MLSECKEMHISAIAVNGQELVTVTSKYSPDVVITDIQMPVMGGAEATRIIKQKFSAIAVVALTSFGEDALILDMLNAGASGYLLKTASKEDLVLAIHTVYKGDRYFCRTTSERLTEMIGQQKPRSAKRTEPAKLSEKEHKIVKLICQQRNTKEIASILDQSPKTIDAYKQKIMEKIHVQNSAGIVVYAVRNGLYKL
jgi:DNA-binding NarL/FixJ family response regulator